MSIVNKDDQDAKALWQLIHLLKNKYNLPKMLQYTHQYRSLQGENKYHMLAIDLLHNVTMGMFGYCIQKIDELAKEFEGAKYEEDRQKTMVHYRLFKVVCKICMLLSDKFWLKYYPTQRLLSMYFALLLDKLKLKAQTDDRANTKIVKAYITYSLYTLKFLKNKKDAIGLLIEIKDSEILNKC